MLDISKCFPYKSNNYQKYFINLEVLKAIHEYANTNPKIEKIYAKGSIIYGIMMEGSDIDHVRIKTTYPLSLNEKIKLVNDLEIVLKKFNITKIQRVKEDNYVRVFYDYRELIDFPLALTIKDEIYPNPHIIKCKNKKKFIKKVYKRAYKYSNVLDNKWIQKTKNKFSLLTK